MAGGKRIRKADGRPLFDARFTPEQDAQIRAEYEAGANTVELAEKWGGGSTSITRAIFRAGGKIRTSSEAKRLYASKHRSQRRLFSDEHEAAIAEEYKQGASTENLAREHNCCPYTISSILERLDVPPRPTGGVRTCELNEAAFDDAENNPMASYFAGLLFADGCVHYRSQGQASVTISLYNDGIWLVEQFKAFLGATHKIYVTAYKTDTGYTGTKAQFSVRSNRLANSLEKYGIVPRKSLTATVSRTMQHNRDWWRGVVDGDGSLSCTRRGYPLLGICGSRPTCEAFRAFVQSLTSTKANVTKAGNIWSFQTAALNAIRVAERLYRDCCIALPRKKEKADHMIEMGKQKGIVPV